MMNPLGGRGRGRGLPLIHNRGIITTIIDYPTPIAVMSRPQPLQFAQILSTPITDRGTSHPRLVTIHMVVHIIDKISRLTGPPLQPRPSLFLTLTGSIL
jgi:hypothetical protein